MIQRDRKTYLGSSEMSAVLGLNPWMTRSDLYYSKIEGRQKEESEAMKWGTLLEPVIIREFCRMRGYEDWVEQSYSQHELHEFIAGTADALTQRLIEVKTTNEFVHRKWSEQIPVHYKIQCNFLMGLNRKEECDFVVLVAGQKLREYILQYDSQLYEKTIYEAVKFWNEHILTQTPPSDF